MTMLALPCVPAFILGMSGVASVLPSWHARLNNAGPHGFSELLYAYTSGAATNGSAFARHSTTRPGGCRCSPAHSSQAAFLGPVAEHFAMQAGSAY